MEANGGNQNEHVTKLEKVKIIQARRDLWIKELKYLLSEEIENQTGSEIHQRIGKNKNSC